MVIGKVTGCVFFFFQAEDGIRDDLVTGVQTCALPISCRCRRRQRTTGSSETITFLREPPGATRVGPVALQEAWRPGLLLPPAKSCPHSPTRRWPAKAAYRSGTP